MTDRDSELARRLIDHLDRGTARVGPVVLGRLREARETALAALDGNAGVVVNGNRRRNGPRRHAWVVATRWAAVAALVIGTGVGWQQWRRVQLVEQAHEYAALDTQILSSDLPVGALLDRGFHNWLNTSYEH